MEYEVKSEVFRDACAVGDEDKVKSLVKQDPGIINKLDSLTGRMGLRRGHDSIRWLLSLPGVDTNHRYMPMESNFTALHVASSREHSLDFVITLTQRNSPP